MSEDTKACAYCGGTIRVGSIVCVHCGKDMQGRQRRPSGDVQKAQSVLTQKMPAWTMALIIGGAAAGALMAMFGNKQPEGASDPVASYRAAPALVVKQEPTAVDQERQRQADADAKRANERLERDAVRSLLKPIDQIVLRWVDAYKLAASTPRIALAGPVASMQAIRREAGVAQVPSCLALGHSALVVSMDETLDGFMIFMRNPNADPQQVDPKLQRASALLESYSKARERCLS